MNSKKLILIGVMMMTLISVGLMGFVNYTMYSSTPFKWGTGADVNKFTDPKGTEAADVWKSKKYLFLSPTVMNLIGAAMLGLLIFTK